MKKILSFILACSMILSLGFNVHIHAESEDNQSSSQQTQVQQNNSGGDEERILLIENLAADQPGHRLGDVSVTVRVDNLDAQAKNENSNAYGIQSGQRVVISASGMTKGRKIRWSAKSPGDNPVQDWIDLPDFVGNIFEAGNANSGNPQSINDINKKDQAISTISFTMPDQSLALIIQEKNDKIRFYGNSGFTLEEPPHVITSKDKVLISQLRAKPYRHGNTSNPLENVNYELVDNRNLSYENGSITPKLTGLKPENDVSARAQLLAIDEEANIGVYTISIEYDFHELVTKDLDIKIYDPDGRKTTPSKISEDPDGKRYAIAEKDKVTVTAEEMKGKKVVGWKIVKKDGSTNLDVMGEHGTFDQDMGSYAEQSVSFIVDSGGKNAPTSIKPIYEDEKYQMTIEQTASDKAEIVIAPSADITFKTPVTIKATAKNAGKRVKALLYNYDNGSYKIDYQEGGITIAMPAFDMTITDVELEDKASSNPPSQNPPSSDNNSDSGSSSGSGSGSSSNAGSGSGSSVERISPTPKKENPIKDSKKSEDEKKDLNKAPQVQKPDGQSPQTPNTSDTENMIEKVFGDVKSDDWFAKSVAFVKEYDLMRGTGEKTFSPHEKTSRAMLITILHRLSGSVQVEKKMRFEDVKADAYYVNALDWAIQNEIVKGFEDGTFRGDDVITREQVALMLFQYAKAQKKDISKRENLMKFTDENQISSYAHEALQWAHAQGLILGKGGNLDPKGNATRAEIATVIMRFIEQFQKQ